MGKRTSVLGLVAFGIVSGLLNIQPAPASAIPDGDLVVLRVGDGTTAAAGTGLNVSILDYAVTYTGSLPTGLTLQQVIPVNATPAASGNRALTQGGTAAAEGSLGLSPTGQYVTFAGYNAALGAAASGGTADRVIGRLDRTDGSIDTTTALTGISGSSSGARSAVTSNGSDMWLATSAQGIRYAALGATTSAALTSGSPTSLTSTRRVAVRNNQLYLSTSSGAIQGPATVGSGLPTSGTQTVTELNGFPTATGPSPYDFWFADDNTIYQADDRTSVSGGLEKWVLTAGTWTKVYTKNLGAINGVRGLTGLTDASGNVSLFVTASWGTAATPNQLIGLSDTLANTSAAAVTSNVILDASTAFTGTSWTLRGLAVTPSVPEPASLSLIAMAALPLVRRRR